MSNRRTSANIRKADSASGDSTGSNHNNQNKYNSNANNNNFVRNWAKNSNIFGIIFKIAGIILIIVFGWVIYQKSQTGILNLMNIDAKLLNETLTFHNHNKHNELPYLFYCDRPLHGNKKKDNTLDSIPPLFTELNNLKTPAKMNFAVLNCSQQLIYTGDGKNIYDKFKLKKEIKPVIWGKTPWNNHHQKVIQATGNHLKDVASMKKFIDVHFKPRAVVVDSDKQFQKYCGFKKQVTHDPNDIQPTCILIIKGDRYQAKFHTDLEEKLVLNFPHIRFGITDGHKARLSFEDYQTITTEHFGIKLHAVRNGTHYLEMVNPPTWDYIDTFISYAASIPLSDYRQEEDKVVKLIKPKPSKAAKPEKKAEPTEKTEQSTAKQAKKQPTSSASSKKQTDSGSSSNPKDTEEMKDEATLSAEKEKAKQDQIERERKIREEMDRQARKNLFDDSEDLDEIDENSSDEGDDELIEL